MTHALRQRAVGSAVWCACKVWEFCLRVVTAILGGARRDQTTILIDAYTEAQSLAARGAKTPTPKSTDVAPLLVVVPFRDRWAITEKCLKSLYNQNLNGRALNIALADNGSAESATAAGISAVAGWSDRGGSWRTHHLRVNGPFNFSVINNEAVRRARGNSKWVLFLNNDIEFHQTQDLARLVDFATQGERIGAVGCTLDFPNGEVQHLFVAPGVKIVAAHPLKGLRLNADAAWFREPRPVAAVTGAAMLVRLEDFDAVGGFDEKLPTVGQDVDLCLKLQKRGLVNWVVPGVRLVHHEGATRGSKIAASEVEYIYGKWGDFLRFNPYFSDRLSRFSEPPAWSPWRLSYPWRQVMARWS